MRDELPREARRPRCTVCPDGSELDRAIRQAAKLSGDVLGRRSWSALAAFADECLGLGERRVEDGAQLVRVLLCTTHHAIRPGPGDPRTNVRKRRSRARLHEIDSDTIPAWILSVLHLSTRPTAASTAVSVETIEAALDAAVGGATAVLRRLLESDFGLVDERVANVVARALELVYAARDPRECALARRQADMLRWLREHPRIHAPESAAFLRARAAEISELLERAVRDRENATFLAAALPYVTPLLYVWERHGLRQDVSARLANLSRTERRGIPMATLLHARVEGDGSGFGHLNDPEYLETKIIVVGLDARVEEAWAEARGRGDEAELRRTLRIVQVTHLRAEARISLHRGRYDEAMDGLEKGVRIALAEDCHHESLAISLRRDQANVAVTAGRKPVAEKLLLSALALGSLQRPQNWRRLAQTKLDLAELTRDTDELKSLVLLLEAEGFLRQLDRPLPDTSSFTGPDYQPVLAGAIARFKAELLGGATVEECLRERLDFARNRSKTTSILEEVERRERSDESSPSGRRQRRPR